MFAVCRTSEEKRTWHAYGDAPKSVIANLLPHFAGPSRDILEERLGGQVVDPEQNFPYPISQRRILQKDRMGGWDTERGDQRQCQRAEARTALDGMPSMRMSRRSFLTLSSTSSGVRDFEDSFGCDRILLNACAVAARSAASPIVGRDIGSLVICCLLV